mgnify:FL=1
MKLNQITIAVITACTPITMIYAAAMDRSGQSIAGFLQPNNYFEAGISALDPTVEGQEGGVSATQRHLNDMGDDYYFPSAVIKLQIADNISFGLLYDQPFGAKVKYTGNNIFVSDDTTTILDQKQLDGMIEKKFTSLTADQRVGLVIQATKGTEYLKTAAGQSELAQTLTAYNANENVKNQIDAGVKNGIKTQVDATKAYLGKGNTAADVDSDSLSMIFGYQPIKNINLYAGGVYQTLEGKLHLRGQATSVYNGYDATLKKDSGMGWLAGAAYQIPEIALKASITYRSEIDHEANTKENITSLPALVGLGLISQNEANQINGLDTKTKFSTPQSVNLDFQSGIMKDTVAFANVRWVNWKKFELQPAQFGAISKIVGQLESVDQPNGFNLLKYSDDQWSANVGVGRKLSEQWAGNVSVGWDSGAGNPVTALGPTEGYWNLGIGAQFSPTPQTFIAGGVKYFWLGDAEGQIASQSGKKTYVANFTDNTAIAYGLKIGYRF